MAKEKKEKGAVKKAFYKKWWFWVIIIVVLAGIFGSGGTKDEENADTPPTATQQVEQKDVDTSKEPEAKADEDVTEDIKESEDSKKEYEQQATNGYGWTTSDYNEFWLAINTIAENYLTNYKLPYYNKWQFAKFDDEGRIMAVTQELTFKDSHDKHTVICVFSLSGDIGEDGFHEQVNWNFFGTDEKTYYDDGSCDEVFENIMSLGQYFQ